MPRDYITREKAAIFDTANPIFNSLLKEYRKLSNKKPDATLSKVKVAQLNAVLTDMLSVFKDEPQIKYLSLVEDEDLPQYSDVVLLLAQFEAAANSLFLKYKNGGHWYADWRFEFDVTDEEED